VEIAVFHDVSRANEQERAVRGGSV
jgi:hypothetical protein